MPVRGTELAHHETTFLFLLAHALAFVLLLCLPSIKLGFILEMDVIIIV